MTTVSLVLVQLQEYELTSESADSRSELHSLHKKLLVNAEKLLNFERQLKAKAKQDLRAHSGQKQELQDQINDIKLVARQRIAKVTSQYNHLRDDYLHLKAKQNQLTGSNTTEERIADLLSELQASRENFVALSEKHKKQLFSARSSSEKNLKTLNERLQQSMSSCFKANEKLARERQEKQQIERKLLHELKIEQGKCQLLHMQAKLLETELKSKVKLFSLSNELKPKKPECSSETPSTRQISPSHIYETNPNNDDEWEILVEPDGPNQVSPTPTPPTPPTPPSSSASSSASSSSASLHNSRDPMLVVDDIRRSTEFEWLCNYNAVANVDGNTNENDKALNKIHLRKIQEHMAKLMQKLEDVQVWLSKNCDDMSEHRSQILQFRKRLDRMNKDWNLEIEEMLQLEARTLRQTEHLRQKESELFVQMQKLKSEILQDQTNLQDGLEDMNFQMISAQQRIRSELTQVENRRENILKECQVSTLERDGIIQEIDNMKLESLQLEHTICQLHQEKKELEENITALRNRQEDAEKSVTNLEAKVSEFQAKMSGMREEITSQSQAIESKMQDRLRLTSDKLKETRRNVQQEVDKLLASKERFRQEKKAVEKLKHDSESMRDENIGLKVSLDNRKEEIAEQLKIIEEMKMKIRQDLVEHSNAKKEHQQSVLKARKIFLQKKEMLKREFQKLINIRKQLNQNTAALQQERKKLQLHHKQMEIQFKRKNFQQQKEQRRMLNQRKKMFGILQKLKIKEEQLVRYFQKQNQEHSNRGDRQSSSSSAPSSSSASLTQISPSIITLTPKLNLKNHVAEDSTSTGVELEDQDESENENNVNSRRHSIASNHSDHSVNSLDSARAHDILNSSHTLLKNKKKAGQKIGLEAHSILDHFGSDDSSDERQMVTASSVSASSSSSSSSSSSPTTATCSSPLPTTILTDESAHFSPVGHEFVLLQLDDYHMNFENINDVNLIEHHEDIDVAMAVKDLDSILEEPIYPHSHQPQNSDGDESPAMSEDDVADLP